MYYLAPPQDDRRGEWGTTPQGSGGAPQRPIPTPAPEATKPLEEKTERPEPPGPGAEPAPNGGEEPPAAAPGGAGGHEQSEAGPGEGTQGLGRPLPPRP